MHIGDYRLHTINSLKPCLAFDAIKAWRGFMLQRRARDAVMTRPEPNLGSLGWHALCPTGFGAGRTAAAGSGGLLPASEATPWRNEIMMLFHTTHKGSSLDGGPPDQAP